jgi:hypothetical protein
LLLAAVNRTSNVALADRLGAACIRVRAARTVWWSSNEATFTPLLEEDLPFVRELFEELGEEPCTAVEPRLRAPFAIAFIETWQGEPWPQPRMERLRGVIARMRTRCVPTMRALLSELEGLGDPDERDAPSFDEVAEEACAGMTESLERFGASDREATEPLTLSEWPEQLEAMARALESVVGP